MNIVEICVGLPREVEYRGRKVVTGIFKSPVDGTVDVRFGNLQGDRQADLTVHGGRDKAIYAYPQEHYKFWSDELTMTSSEASVFGENLTVRGMNEDQVVIGTKYRAGSALVSVTQPRIPCFKLGIRVDDSAFPAKFLVSGKLGFYLRVEEEGVFQAGDKFETVSVPSHGITLQHLWTMVFGDRDAELEIDVIQHKLPYLDAGWLRRLRRLRNRSATKRAD